MSQYYIGAVPFGSGALAHTNEGTKWKKHKYLYIQNGRYIYPEDVRGGGGNSAARAARSGRTVSGPSVPRRQTGAFAGRPIQQLPKGSRNNSRIDRQSHRPAAGFQLSYDRPTNSMHYETNDDKYSGRNAPSSAGERASRFVENRLSTYSVVARRGLNQSVSSITSWGASAVNAGRSWIQRAIQSVSNTATDIYKLGTGAYVREAQAAYDRNPSPENMNALREAQSRYDNSIFGRVRSLIARAITAVRGAASSAGDAARGAASSVGNAARGAVRRVGAATGLNGKRRSTGNRAGISAYTPNYLGVPDGRNSRRDMYLNRAADVASNRTRPRR